jgi:hypothetical protein
MGGWLVELDAVLLEPSRWVESEIRRGKSHEQALYMNIGIPCSVNFSHKLWIDMAKPYIFNIRNSILVGWFV